jgi:TPR repeat protein
MKQTRGTLQDFGEHPHRRREVLRAPFTVLTYRLRLLWLVLSARSWVPISFIEAAEYFQMAANGDNADGENGLAICLERGLGIDKDPDQAVSYYRRAASERHPAGMNNLGRCLEYGLALEPGLLRAAKYYRLSAELQNADGINNFGICLERGIGIQANIDLAAEYYKRAADSGHADGANSFGFCLEHGRGPSIINGHPISAMLKRN